MRQGNPEGKSAGGVIGGVEAGTHRGHRRSGTRAEAGGPDGAGAEVERLTIKVPEAQHPSQILLEVGGAREPLEPHQQPGRIDQVFVRRGLNGQQAIDHLAIGRMEGVILLRGDLIGHGPRAVLLRLGAPC